MTNFFVLYSNFIKNDFLIRSKYILWSPCEKLVQSLPLSIDVHCFLAYCGRGSILSETTTMVA